MVPFDADTSVTELLQRYSGGDSAVAESLFREILPTLHQLAVRQLSRERYIAPVSPTELINELWLRNLRNGGWNVHNRQHFYAIVSIAMRRVLIDLARSRLALVRGRGEIHDSIGNLQVEEPLGSANLEQIVAMGHLMERLEKKDPVAARIVDLHYFAGYTHEEIAEITGVPVRSVRYKWKTALTWLKRQMGR
jgi:RNA polymerase sigma factor (TIGR02999 family)